MKNFKLYSILFILSFFLFTCEDDGENVKEKDKFTTIHDKTYWSDGETGGDYPWSEGWYITKDQINIYYEETYDGEVYKHCEKIPLKDGIFTDQDGYEHLLNILVNNQDTLHYSLLMLERPLIMMKAIGELEKWISLLEETF